MTVQKIDKTMNWFCNYCIPCDVDLEQVGNRFKCPKCGKFKPYPDRRLGSYYFASQLNSFRNINP